MSREQDAARLGAWLQARGWLHGYAGWTHPDFPESREPTGWSDTGGVGASEAFYMQQRRDREAATAHRDTDIRDADAGAEDAVTLLETSAGAILAPTSEDERSRQTVGRLTAPMLNPSSSLEVNT